VSSVPDARGGVSGPRGALVPAVRTGASVRATVAAYVALTKPRIIELLLVTTVPAMVVAAGGFPDLRLVAATLLGGALAAGSANTFNSYLESDIDEVMERTRRRPLPEHRVPRRNALGCGLVLGVAAFGGRAATVNLLAAGLATAAILFYVFVYTVGLKRRSEQNIVIGGAAGCVPVLVGWAAVTGEVGLPALLMFAIVFYWTPPHFWALALRYRDDYARAGVPMLPVVRGAAETARQIVLYTIMMVAVTLMFGAIAGMGTIYLVAAVTLGAGFLVLALHLRRAPTEAHAMRLFRYSITYLGLLFAAMAVDAILP
jgi:heme o synthase